MYSMQGINKWQVWLSLSALFSIAAHFLLIQTQFADIPLLAVIALGGLPLLVQIALKLLKGDFGADLMAIIALITAKHPTCADGVQFEFMKGTIF